MNRILYQWSADGESEVCRVERAVTKTDIDCSHCGCVIPAQTSVAKLTTLQDVYLMHWDCAIQGACTFEHQNRVRALRAPNRANVRNKKLTDFLKENEQ